VRCIASRRGSGGCSSSPTIKFQAWLDTEYPGITVVSHREIFGDTGRLPTFNSHAIESRLHRIPGLAEALPLPQ
jgi:hypothetical protein